MGKRYWYLDFDEIGFNYRMTDAQAAVGLVQLRKLDSFNARRIEIANMYSEGWRGSKDCTLPFILAQNQARLSRLLRTDRDPISRANKEDFMWELYTEQTDQGVVALHAHPLDHCVPRHWATSRENVRSRKSFSTNTSVFPFTHE